MIKGDILKQQRKQIMLRETNIRMIVNFLSKTMQTRRKWSNIFKVVQIKKNFFQLEWHIQQKRAFYNECDRL